MQSRVNLVQAARDQIAQDYGRPWSMYLRAPRARLTAALGLMSGVRCEDEGDGWAE